MTKINSERGLYVHVPFCAVKCFYCDFTAFSGQRSFVQRYLRALDMEAERNSGLPVQTFYIGGGTPSELTEDELLELLRIVDHHFGSVRNFRESTIEANPESLSAKKLDLLSRWGMRRISIGIQTAEPRLLREIGRKHTVDEFFAVYRLARQYSFSVNVDLMYGLPTQTVEEAVHSLETVLALQPDHVSVYGLQVEDQTLFAKRNVDPQEDLQREIFELYLDRLKAAGFRHYEISNFARPGHESIHNQVYWRDGEYIGLGCGASGHVQGVRYTNKDRLAEYCEAIERGESPAAEKETLTGKNKLGESLFLGLRMLEGVELTPEIKKTFCEELRIIQERGWVEVVVAPIPLDEKEKGGRKHQRRLRLTREGIFLANRVFEEFVPPFRTAKSLPAVQSFQGS